MTTTPEEVQATQDAAERWAQQVIDAELGRPPTDEQMARLMVGSAILLTGLAKVAGLSVEQVGKLVARYSERVLIVSARKVANG